MIWKLGMCKIWIPYATTRGAHFSVTPRCCTGFRPPVLTVYKPELDSFGFCGKWMILQCVFAKFKCNLWNPYKNLAIIYISPPSKFDWLKVIIPLRLQIGSYCHNIPKFLKAVAANKGDNGKLKMVIILK